MQVIHDQPAAAAIQLYGLDRCLWLLKSHNNCTAFRIIAIPIIQLPRSDLHINYPLHYKKRTSATDHNIVKNIVCPNKHKGNLQIPKLYPVSPLISIRGPQHSL